MQIKSIVATRWQVKLGVTGKSGQLATALAELGRARGIDIVHLARPDFDLMDTTSVDHGLAAAAPNLVVNAAAYTDVDRAEAETPTAYAVNAMGAERVARACAAHRIPLIHISTDYVFDGRKAAPYVETDPIAPLSSYGRSKAEGERRVAAVCPEHVILRTAWVHSPFGRNFVKTMLRIASERSEVAVVNDQLGSPTYAPHLAAAIVAIAERLLHGPPAWGIYHAVGCGTATWRDVAEAIFKVSRDLGGPWATVRGIASADYPVAASRPANSRLDTSKLAQTFDVRLANWREGLTTCVTRVLAEQR